jgi:hypothetical protein
METLVGPAWTTLGLTYAAGRYPLRVETHVLRLVNRLIPGVITTTTQARMYALHALAWTEAHRRELELSEALDLLRRCEVVVAGASLCHEEHLSRLPSPHGYEAVGPHVQQTETLPVADLSRPGEYVKYEWGFASTYLGSEMQLGILRQGRPPIAGDRYNDPALREGFKGLLELADRDVVAVSDLNEAPHLCVCAGPNTADGAWLRRLLFEGGLEDWTDIDESRRATARLLLRVVADAGETRDVPGAFRHAIGFGASPGAAFDGLDAVVAEGWRGAVLRNYSVGAWRRLWSWLVEQLTEPLSVTDLAEAFAEALPEDVSIAEMVQGLPMSQQGDELLPAEEELRGRSRRDPWIELQLLALGGQRLGQLKDRAHTAFAGSTAQDDLGPRWVARRLAEHPEDPVRSLARELTELLVRRARRVALSKMELRKEGFWLPSRVREREGVLFRSGEEGASDVALRTDTLRDVLCGVGALHRDPEGLCRVTDYGEQLLG